MILGGKTRFESLKNALKNIDTNKYKILMVHDAARPVVPKDTMLKLLTSMVNQKYHCSIPASVVEDTLRKKNITLVRKNYKTYKNPQFFNLRYIKNKLKNLKIIPTDDLGVIEKSKNLKIKFIETSKTNIKITKKDDIKVLENMINFNTRFANGFDIHKLKKGIFSH